MCSMRAHVQEFRVAVRPHVSCSTGLGWCFAYQLDKDCWWIMFWGIALMCSGILYGWAYIRGERFEDEASIGFLSHANCIHSLCCRIKASRAWASTMTNCASKLSATLPTPPYRMSSRSTHPAWPPRPLQPPPCRTSSTRRARTSQFAWSCPPLALPTTSDTRCPCSSGGARCSAITSNDAFPPNKWSRFTRKV